MNKRFPPLFVLAVFILTLAGFTTVRAESPAIAWKKLGDDLEMATVRVSSGTFLSSNLALVRTGLERYRVGVIRALEYGTQRAPVRNLCRQSRAVACVNANFFDERGDPLGLVISKGTEHNRLHRRGNTLTGIFQVNRVGFEVIDRRDFKPGTVMEAIQAGPRLLANGAPVPGIKDTSSRRSGLCTDGKHHLILFASEPGLGGVSVGQLQSILRSPEVDCLDALNLDGGGSSQLYLRPDPLGSANGTAEIYLAGRDEVPVALGLFLEG